MTKTTSLLKKIRSFGPGIVLAGVAIGGSHIIQSTRAGANYGFGLIIVILLAHLFKYPFLAMSSRYTISTGHSLLHGYKRVGDWALVSFGLLTLSTMFFIQAALLLVTAGLAESLFEFSLDTKSWSLILAITMAFILFIGRYQLLDKIMKLLVLVLSVSTATAVTLGFVIFFKSDVPYNAPAWGDIFSYEGLFFMVAMVGWMPILLDGAVWHSLWTIEKRKTNFIRLKDSLFDFNVGYILTALLAVCFLSLGVIFLYQNNIVLSNSGVIFSRQLISSYQSSLGEWATPIIKVSAFTTMFSTALAVLDIYPRVLRKITKMHYLSLYEKVGGKAIHNAVLIFLATTSVFLIFFFSSKMKQMLDLATTISFLTTPYLAWITYLVMRLPNRRRKVLTPNWFLRLAEVGIVFWSLFALVFISKYFLN